MLPGQVLLTPAALMSTLPHQIRLIGGQWKRTRLGVTVGEDHHLACVHDGADADAARVVHEWLFTAWAGDESTTASSLARKLGTACTRVESAIDLGRRLAVKRLMELGVKI